MSRSTPLNEALQSAAETLRDKNGRDVGIVCFNNYYTQILAEAFWQVGCHVTVHSAAIGGYQNRELEDYVLSRGLWFQSHDVSIQKAYEHGTETGQPALLRAAMDWMVEDLDDPWYAIPDPFRLIPIDTVWHAAWVHGLRFWYYNGLNSNLLWSQPDLLLAYLYHPTILKLIRNQTAQVRQCKPPTRASRWSFDA